jgi:hypothetical protein
MAGNSTAGGRVVSNTLTANTVDLVFLSQPGQAVQVENVTGTAPIWFTVSHPGGTAQVPTVGGTSDCFCAASVAGAVMSVRHDGMYGSVVQLISTGTPTYTVSVGSRMVNV